MTALTALRPTWAEIDLDRVAHNTRALLGYLRPGARLMAVVKADGYGHGAAPVARAALQAGAAWLGVAILDEALSLRREGVNAPTLVLGYVPPGQAEAVVEHDVRTALLHHDLAVALDARARALGRRARVHLKVDTGMGRLGLSDPSAVVALARAAAALPGIEVEGVFTHLAKADEADAAYTARQMEQFRGILAALGEAGIPVAVRHAANSAGILAHPDTHFDLVRAGIALYGLYPSAEVPRTAGLRPAMAWKTRISFIKTMPPGAAVSYGGTYSTQGGEAIATLPVGYADGYSRAWSNRGQVLVRGRRCPVVGRVCMDQIMIALPPDHRAAVGDEAVLLGHQGRAELSADQLAAGLGTISYEVVCQVGARVPRLYRRGGRLQV